MKFIRNDLVVFFRGFARESIASSRCFPSGSGRHARGRSFDPGAPPRGPAVRRP
jgi:hypothetical protein